ncbi:immune inhibitor A [bacterium]|nr:immune inhibitor A [bacterium]
MSKYFKNLLVLITVCIITIFPVILLSEHNNIRQEIIGSFTGQYGTGWEWKWNDKTDLPHRIWGEGIPVGEVYSSQQAETVCRVFIENNPYLFPIEMGSLRLATANKKMNTWYVMFDQYYDDLPVWNSRVHFRIKKGNIILIGVDIIPNLELNSEPSISLDRAAEICRDFAQFTDYEGELGVFDGEGSRLGWWLRTENQVPFQKFHFYVDAHNGEMLFYYDNIRYAFGGYVTGDVLPEYPSDRLVEIGLSNIIIETEGGVKDTADASGIFNVPVDVPPSGIGTWINLRSPYCEIINVASSPAMWGGMVRDDSLLYIHFDISIADTSEISVYYHTNFIHDWYKILDPDFNDLDYPMEVYVEDTVSPTPDNAFWDGSGMHFGRGNSCNNFGHFSEVVYHEYTHGVTHFIYPMGSLPYTGQSGAMDEAFSDYFPCSILNDSQHGEGVCSASPFRELDNGLRYPESWVGEVHADGAIISGAFWDMREVFGAGYTDTLVHYARYGWAENFEDFLVEVLVVDDDDGNLNNGTPHFWEIYNAFQAHGIGEFKISIMPRLRPDTEDTEHPYPVYAYITSTLPLDVESILLHYSTGTGFISLLMTETEEDYVYIAEIPPQPEGSTVNYYFSAMDTAGTYEVLPEDAPDSYFSFYVGMDLVCPELEHRHLEDQALEMYPYLVTARAWDNVGIDRVIILYQHNSGDLDTVIMTNDTLDIYVGYLEGISVSLGDSFDYKIIAEDSSIACNCNMSPVTGYHRFKVVRSIFVDFEEDNGGFESTGDWEWGVPSEEGPETAHSGMKLWATILDGYHSDGSNSQLNTTAFDLSDFCSATLEFYHYYRTEFSYDGGNVKISTDDGETWNLIFPIKGYPMLRVVGLGEEGFSGATDGWEKVQFDLLPYIGRTVKIQFDFKSDEYLTAPGWYIDDVGVLEKQILLPPQHVTAASGYDSYVPISWAAPALASSIYRSTAPESFMGYNIYRSEVSGYYDSEPVNGSIVTDTFYLDADALNEVEYFYIVTSVYSEGESQPSNEARAMAFNAELEVSPDVFHITLPEDGLLDTVMTLSNVGSGYLNYNIYEELDDPLSRFTKENGFIDGYSRALIPPHGVWRRLAEDPDDPDVELDIAALYAQHSGNFLYFMIKPHQPMGNPSTDYVVAFSIDADMNPATGDDRIPGMGLEYIVAMGALPMGWESVILEYDPSSPYGWSPAGEAHWTLTPENGDSVACGITFSVIGNPDEILISAMTVRDLMSMTSPEDIIPEGGGIYYSAIEAPWLFENPIQGIINGGTSQSITLTFDADGLAPAEYYAWLRIQTNDWEALEYYVPIQLTVISTGVTEDSKLPGAYSLGYATPNPFNSTSAIQFSVPEKTEAELMVYDVLGKEVTTLLDRELEPGNYLARWDGLDQYGRQMPTGIYFYKLETPNYEQKRKVLLLK